MRHWPYLFLLATSLLIAALVRDLSSPTYPARIVALSKTPAAGAGPVGPLGAARASRPVLLLVPRPVLRAPSHGAVPEGV